MKEVSVEEIAKGNNLIALFDGFEIAGTAGANPEKILAFYYPEEHPTNTGIVPAEDLKFHTSWDWLMSVVEKIEAESGGGRYSVMIKENRCWIELNTHFCVVPAQISDTKIKAVWKAVTEYITFKDRSK